MPLLGSDGGFQADNRGGIIDELGNTVVSAATSFAASPLGVAARTQALYGIANANFNLTPPSPQDPIVANQNDLPYWSIEELSDGVMTATTVFDATTQTWGVELNPGTAASGATLSLSTRSYVLTDDNLALRQKAQAVLAKSGTAAVTTQWNLTLTAIYYDSTDTALSTAVIGTALDTGTWTSLAGTTTPGGSAINSAAQYVDLTFTLTTTAAVTGSAKATIKSLLLTTSVPGGGGSQSFIIADLYTSSGSWVRPTGVDYVSVVGAGAGGGGQSGMINTGTATARGALGGDAGGGGRWAIIRDVYVGDQGTVSIGVGAGGTGGTANLFTKASGSTTQANSVAGVYGAAGGDSTFGSLITWKGGQAGSTGSTSGDAGGPTVSTVWLPVEALGGDGGQGGAATGGAGGDGGTSGFNGYSQIPYSTAEGAASLAGTGSGSGGAQTVSTVGTTSSGWIGGAGGGSGGSAASSPNTAQAGDGRNGAGAGGAARMIYVNAATTITGTAGNGTDAAANTGAGGGGGGALAAASSSVANYQNSTLTLSSGAGGNGASGWVTVIYIA